MKKLLSLLLAASLLISGCAVKGNVTINDSGTPMASSPSKSQTFYSNHTVTKNWDPTKSLKNVGKSKKADFVKFVNNEFIKRLGSECTLRIKKEAFSPEGESSGYEAAIYFDGTNQLAYFKGNTSEDSDWIESKIVSTKGKNSTYTEDRYESYYDYDADSSTCIFFNESISGKLPYINALEDFPFFTEKDTTLTSCKVTEWKEQNVAVINASGTRLINEKKCEYTICLCYFKDLKQLLSVNMDAVCLEDQTQYTYFYYFDNNFNDIDSYGTFLKCSGKIDTAAKKKEIKEEYELICSNEYANDNYYYFDWYNNELLPIISPDDKNVTIVKTPDPDVYYVLKYDLITVYSCFYEYTYENGTMIQHKSPYAKTYHSIPEYVDYTYHFTLAEIDDDLKKPTAGGPEWLAEGCKILVSKTLAEKHPTWYTQECNNEDFEGQDLIYIIVTDLGFPLKSDMSTYGSQIYYWGVRGYGYM